MYGRFHPAETFSLGEYLREEMDARGWDVEELAARCNLSDGVVSDLVNDLLRPNVWHVIVLARAFEVSEDLICNLDQKPWW